MLGLLLSLLASVSVYGSVSDCSNGKALITIDSMSFKPDPTVPGMNSTLLLSLSVPEEITNGTVTYSTVYNFLPLTPTVEDLCATVPCPIAVGSLDTVSSYPIGTGLSGVLTLKIEWTELTGRQLLCVLIKTKLGAYDKQLVLRKTKNKVCKVNSTFFTNETYRH